MGPPALAPARGPQHPGRPPGHRPAELRDVLPGREQPGAGAALDEQHRRRGRLGDRRAGRPEALVPPALRQSDHQQAGARGGLDDAVAPARDDQRLGGDPGRLLHEQPGVGEHPGDRLALVGLPAGAEQLERRAGGWRPATSRARARPSRARRRRTARPRGVADRARSGRPPSRRAPRRRTRRARCSSPTSPSGTPSPIRRRRPSVSTRSIGSRSTMCARSEPGLVEVSATPRATTPSEASRSRVSLIAREARSSARFSDCRPPRTPAPAPRGGAPGER